MKNFTIMRYAEVLLMYAEALIQQNKDGALPYIQMIQNRAGSQTVSTVANMEVLKKEKKYELWLEDCRWADMVRWGDLSGVMENGYHVPWLYDKLTKPASGNVVGWSESGRFYVVDSHKALDDGFKVGYKNMQETKGLFPYPFDVMEKTPTLVQNEGWN